MRDLLPPSPDPRIRVRTLAPVPDRARCVVYWMQRARVAPAGRRAAR